MPQPGTPFYASRSYLPIAMAGDPAAIHAHLSTLGQFTREAVDREHGGIPQDAVITVSTYAVQVPTVDELGRPEIVRTDGEGRLVPLRRELWSPAAPLPDWAEAIELLLEVPLEVPADARA
jgi:hypothetical protein